MIVAPFRRETVGKKRLAVNTSLIKWGMFLSEVREGGIASNPLRGHLNSFYIRSLSLPGKCNLAASLNCVCAA